MYLKDFKSDNCDLHLSDIKSEWQSVAIAE